VYIISIFIKISGSNDFQGSCCFFIVKNFKKGKAAGGKKHL